MALSINEQRRIIEAVTSQAAGRNIIDAINQGAALAGQSAKSIPAAIIATSVSTTVDFGALKVGDLLIHIPAAAGNSAFESIVTAGTKPSAAIVGDLYVVLRAYAAPAASSAVL